MSESHIQRNILLLATGGTIACSPSENGLRPALTVDSLLNAVQREMDQHIMVRGETIMNIDSSNMVPANWLTIAKAVARNYEQFDGFVITHGTDTMAYTSAALTYLLAGLDRPVVLTGSQYSMMDKRTDALQNLNDALHFACEDLAGVFIAFDGKLINGTRAIKTKTRSYDAFQSVNFPTVAVIKHNQIRYNQAVFEVFNHCRQHPVPTHLPTAIPLPGTIEDNIFVLRLFPGLNPDIFDYIKNSYKGVIIEGYGIGGVSSGILDLSIKVRELTDAGLAVVVTTQTLLEGVDFEIYEVGKKLPLEKIIYAKDMNTEALVPKLMWALGKGNSSAEVKELVERPVNGDIQENPETYYYFHN